MGKSYIADNIMRDYIKKKRYEANKDWAEIQKFIKESCINCKNKDTNLCEIIRNTNGDLQCVFKE